MKTIAPPSLPWLGKRFQCPDCGVVLEPEASDMGALKINPALLGGVWVMRHQCPFCRVMKVFREVTPGGEDDPDMRAIRGQESSGFALSAGKFRSSPVRAVAPLDSGSLPAALSVALSGSPPAAPTTEGVA